MRHLRTKDVAIERCFSSVERVASFQKRRTSSFETGALTVEAVSAWASIGFSLLVSFPLESWVLEEDPWSPTTE